MSKILIDENEFDVTQVLLPLLIHGREGSGASFYTVSLTTNFYSSDFKILFLCGYEMARKEFEKQVEKIDSEKIQFFVKEQVSDFVKSLADEGGTTLVIIKNIELFGEEVFDLLSSRQKIIISGDVEKCLFKEKLSKKHFGTKIFFSDFVGFPMPEIKEYEGYFISDRINGITKIG